MTAGGRGRPGLRPGKGTIARLWQMEYAEAWEKMLTALSLCRAVNFVFLKFPIKIRHLLTFFIFGIDKREIVMHNDYVSVIKYTKEVEIWLDY